MNAEPLTTEKAFELGFQRGAHEMLKAAIECLECLHEIASDAVEYVDRDGYYYDFKQRIDSVHLSSVLSLKRIAANT